jgi:hypothetical protein
MKFSKTIFINRNDDKIKVVIERYAFILDATRQPVYKFIIDDQCICTYFTNGNDYKLYPEYHSAQQWPKEKIDILLKQYLPMNQLKLGV